MALIIVSLAWVLGVWLGSQLEPSPAWLLAAALPLPLLARRQWRLRSVVAALAVVSIVGGALFFQAAAFTADETFIGRYIDGHVYTIEGTVSRAPEEKEKSQALRLSDIVVETADGRVSATGSMMVYLPPFPEFRYGDRLAVTGKLLEPPVFDTFDWRAYLARDEVFATILYPAVVSVEPGHGNPVLSSIYDLRQVLADNLAAALPEPQASLAQGLALGIRSNIPDDVSQKFAVSGTSHLLAISGLHLGIVAGAILVIARGLLGRRGYWYVWLATAAVWGFAVLSGLAPPVVRGAVMASVFLLAELFGRQKSALPALCLAAALMTAANPQVLWSASFQMSFAAMTGLIFLLPPFEELNRRLLSRFPGVNSRFYGAGLYLGEGLAVTAAAVAGVLPLIAYYFGAVSLIGGIATLAAMPVVPLVIFGGLLTGAAALVHPAAALPFAAVTWLGLSFLLGVVGLFARVPAIDIGGFDGAVIWIFYTALAAAAWYLRRWQRRQDVVDAPKPVKLSRAVSLGLPSLVMVGVLASTLLAIPAGGQLKVSFLDVGQGDAIYIRTPAGQDILIDGGPSPQRLAQELGREMPFWDRTIELVVSTHADADHLTGLVEALRRYEVKRVVHSGIGADTDLFGEWDKLLDAKAFNAEAVASGQRIRLDGGLELEVLNPYDTSIADTNVGSLVLSLRYGEISFLFTGDATIEAEQELIYRRLVPDATVLKVAHHGSGGSTGGAFLTVSRPEFAVVQVGQNVYGHPKAGVIAALEAICLNGGVYRTDTSGTIIFVTDGRSLWLKE